MILAIAHWLPPEFRYASTPLLITRLGLLIPLAE
jgi:hypothetical protein